MKNIFILSFLLLLLTACESYFQDDFEEVVVIESYLVANRSLPVVTVSKILPADVEYSLRDAAITDANVFITLIDENGDPVEIFPYFLSSSNLGEYTPVDPSHVVLPTQRYRLDVSFNSRNEIVSATTTVPDQLNVTNQVESEVVYQSEEQLEIVLSPTVQTQAQKFFVFDTISLEPDESNLTPFYSAAVSNGNAALSDFVKNSSGLINEGNFMISQDGSISLNFPWIGAAFYGDNLIVTNSVDTALSEFVRSQDVQLGGSTLSPGEIPNLVYNIEGGIGIFGSISSDTVQTRFLRP